MKITFLGSGTSCGVPFIGCNCHVCTSSDPRDKRWRSSILIEKGKDKVVVDTGYEFRLQCLRANVTDISAILYTHTHPDHLVGLDDLRAFSKKGKAVEIWASKDNLSTIQSSFPYAFKPLQDDGLPHLRGNVAVPGEVFRVGDMEILPFAASHGCRDVMCYRIGNMAYMTDVSDPRMEVNKAYLEGLDLLIVDGLMTERHPAHFSFDEAAAFGKSIGAKRVIFTHITHSLTHREIEEKYKGVAEAAYDTLQVEVDDE